MENTVVVILYYESRTVGPLTYVTDADRI